MDNGGQSYKYHPMPDDEQELQPSLLIGAPVLTETAGTEEIELYYVFPLTQEEESLSLIRSTVIISGIALTLFVVGIGVLVTRLVVDPVRRAPSCAARAGPRRAAGR